MQRDGCAFEGAYCYDGGNAHDNYGCDSNGDEAGPCCGESAGTQCEDCLRTGLDYCISTDSCVPRATESCEVPEDHITGDERFASGAANGVDHSMICPAGGPKIARPDGNSGYEDDSNDGHCRSDICGDIADDCCAPGAEPRVCKIPGYLRSSEPAQF